jgi:putative PIG3 family NAD(P)H quinone oxidoreductase
MASMQAVIITPDGALAWREVDDPVTGPHDALVEVHATALNRADLSQRAGHYPPPPGESDVLGLELSGVVRTVPDGDHGWSVGDRVCALVAGGGYAELARVPVEMLMPVPRGWSLAEAAAMPEVFYTAYLNLVIEGALQRGEQVLIHGGASGVGTAAIQVARHRGCEVAATAGTAEKVRVCADLGAELAINYRDVDFAEIVQAAWGGVDVVLDMVGTDTFARNLELLRVGGRCVVIATLSGHKATIDLRTLMARRARVLGSTLRNRPLAEKIALRDAIVADLWPAFESRSVAPVIDRVVAIEEVEAAHARMRANQNVGKIVLSVRGGASVRDGSSVRDGASVRDGPSDEGGIDR